MQALRGTYPLKTRSCLSRRTRHTSEQDPNQPASLSPPFLEIFWKESPHPRPAKRHVSDFQSGLAEDAFIYPMHVPWHLHAQFSAERARRGIRAIFSDKTRPRRRVYLRRLSRRIQNSSSFVHGCTLPRIRATCPRLVCARGLARKRQKCWTRRRGVNGQ